MKRLRAFACALPLLVPCVRSLPAQGTAPATLQLQGLRSVNHQGSFGGGAFTPDGNLVLLYDQGDGLRLLKTDPGASGLLAQVQLGAAGDTGVAIATDPSGNLYVAGTSSSGALQGTSGAPFPAPVDTSVNSFVAKFDPDLHLLFLTFFGASHTVVTGVAATADAVFVTGLTYSVSLPVTGAAVQPAPAANSDGNGFVQRFSPDGETLVYSTYLTGTDGSTAPAAIVADTSDVVTVAGSTSAPGFPTTSGALQISLPGAVAGFLARLSPPGSGFLSSTFIAGTGLSSVSLDPSSGDLLATGNVDPGQFPIATVSAPLAATPYQSLLRLSPDATTLLDSALLLPGTRSAVTGGVDGTVWITGSLSTSASSAGSATSLGDSYLLHLSSQDVVDGIYRLGGVPTQNPAYAHLTSTSFPAVLNPDGTLLAIPAKLTAATDPSFAATQTFDLPLTGSPPALLANSLRDVLPAVCSHGLPCEGTAAFLSIFSTSPTASAPLSLSTGDFSSLTLRNRGTSPAAALVVAATGPDKISNCPQTLSADAQCTIAVAGSGPGTLSIISSTAPPLSLTLPAAPEAPQALAFDAAELDFGIVTSASSPVSRTITVTNLTATPQSFVSAPSESSTQTSYALVETSSTCAGTPGSHTLPGNSSCSLTLGLSASSFPANNGAVLATWELGSRDVAVTAFTEAALLALSSSVMNFGTQVPGSSSSLPLFLYLSNNSPLPLGHNPVLLPSGSPFTATDNCPATLQPNSVCGIRFTYLQPLAPTLDSISVTLDQGLTVLLQGETTSAQTPFASLTPSPLVASPSLISFSSPVAVSEISTEAQPVQVTNPTQVSVPLTATVLGDFSLGNSCPATLPSGASCTLGLRFMPSQPGTREGLLTLSAGPGTQPITVPLSGTAVSLLTPSNTFVNLGQTSAGEPVVYWTQVQGTLPRMSATISGGSFGVALLGDDGNGHGTLPSTAFAPAATAQCVACWLAIQFSPAAAGNFNASLQLTTDSSGLPATLTVRGTAIPAGGLLLTPAQPDFAAVPIHSTSAPTSFTLTNLLPGALTLSLQSIASTGDFTVLPAASPFACSGALAPASSCRIDVAFAPTATGPRNGVLTVRTSGGSATANLAGTGTPDAGLALIPTTLSFTSSSTSTVTLVNTGTDPVDLSSFATSDPAFTLAQTCSTLPPNQSCTVAVSLSGSPSASPALLTFTATRHNPDEPNQSSIVAVDLLGSAPQPVLAFPTQADFGAQSSETLGPLRQFDLVNTSAVAQSLIITSTRNFPLASADSCTNLPPGGTCTFFALFAPAEAGPLTGNITVTPSGADGSIGTPAVLYLQGYGLGTGSLLGSSGSTPGSPLSFDEIPSGQSATENLTLTNTGTSSVSLRRLTSTAPFQVANTCPASLPPGSACSLTVLYSPVFLQPGASEQSIHNDAGTLLLETDTGDSPVTVYLAGSVSATSSTAQSAPAALPTYTLSQSSLTFANTLPGQRSAAKAVSINNSGTVPVAFSEIAASAGFNVSTTCTTLQPGSACTLTATFDPDSSVNNSTVIGTLTLQSNAATALDFITLLGPSFSTALAASPANLNFNATPLGSSATATVTLTNVTNLPLLFGPPAVQGDFTVSGGTCPAAGGSLAPGASCTYTVTFNPTLPGTRNGTLAVGTDASTQPLKVALQGSALAGHLLVSTTALTFGIVNLNASAAATVTLINNGTANLTGLSPTLTGADPSDFHLGANCPGTLTVGATCTLGIAFAPLASESRTAILNIGSSDPASPTLIALSGTGAQSPGIDLAVNGANTASATVAAGTAASFGLTLTPVGGFSAGVALACTAVQAAPNAVCSLSTPNVSALNGPVRLTAVINTASGYASSAFALFLLPSIPWLVRRRDSGRPRHTVLAVLGCSLLLSMSLASCASGPSSSGSPYTPPGSYLYQVTATSMSGTPLTSTVSLALTVQ